MFELEYVFEDLPLFVDADGFGTACVDGTATVQFGQDGDWRVIAISLPGDRYDSETSKWHGGGVALRKNDLQFKLVEAALLRDCDDPITERVYEDLEESGFTIPVLSYEALTAGDLGVGRHRRAA